MNSFLILVLGVSLLPIKTSATNVFHHPVTKVSSDRSHARALISFTVPGKPILDELQEVTTLPKELPQRVSGFAYDGEKLWAVIYHGKGRYATFDRNTRSWQLSVDSQQHGAIKRVAGLFESPGGVCFGAGKLWVGGSYGESFGAIDRDNWSVLRIFNAKQREHFASQSYAGVAFDGKNLWIAWHWFNYYLPVSETQRLLRINPESGEVLESYPLPGGTATDMTHGLTWDGKQLWHVKDTLLSAIDPANGNVTAQYRLPDLRRPSGLAWDGEALWIAEFRGRIFRLPFARF